jgi:hypothetical protein
MFKKCTSLLVLMMLLVSPVFAQSDRRSPTAIWLKDPLPIDTPSHLPV